MIGPRQSVNSRSYEGKCTLGSAALKMILELPAVLLLVYEIGEHGLAAQGYLSFIFVTSNYKNVQSIQREAEVLALLLQ